MLYKNPLNTLGYFAATAVNPSVLEFMKTPQFRNGLGNFATALSAWDQYRTASTPPSNTPERGFEIINDLSAVQTRPRTPEEVRREAALVGLLATVPGIIATRNIWGGFTLGYIAEKAAQMALDGTKTYKDNYLTREDWDRVEGNSTHSSP